MNFRGKKIAVLMGGASREREISLKTGKAIFEALQRREYDVTAIEIDENLHSELLKKNFDVAFIALHGKYGEDGCVQGLLEWLKIPYTGAGVLGSATAMDKVATKLLAEQLGIRTAGFLTFFADEEEVGDFVRRCKLNFPVVVKPAREGSTINMSIIKQNADLPAALKLAEKSDTRIVVEEFISGKEITVGMVAGQILPAIEIRPHSGLYDYTSKYTKGMTDYICPAELPAAALHEAKESTRKIAQLLELSSLCRADFIVTEQNAAYFLEVNTIPGMTETSLIPKAAKAVGMSFEDVCEQLLNAASLKA